MEFLVRLFHGNYPDIEGQKPVQRLLKIPCWDWILNAYRCYLRQRVHSGIRPSRSGNMNRNLLNVEECRLKQTLNRWQTGLDLPSLIFGSVVGEG